MQYAALAKEIGTTKPANLDDVIAEEIGKRGIDEIKLEIEKPLPRGFPQPTVQMFSADR